MSDRENAAQAGEAAVEVNLWPSVEHAQDYLRRVDAIPHRQEGEAELTEWIPANAGRILDLGTGGGRLIGLVKAQRPKAKFVGLDFSPTMLAAARERFAGDSGVSVVEHDMQRPLPDLGTFDAVISSFAIHHLADARKKSLYAEVFRVLNRGAVFCNLEHVSSPSARLHREFLDVIHIVNEDPSNKLTAAETQLAWLREIGFIDVDCHWKWREFALLCGVRP